MLRTFFKTITLPLIVFILSIGCQPSQRTDDSDFGDGYPVKIFLSSGDYYPFTEAYNVPAFFNLAYFENSADAHLNALVLAERVNKGRKLKVMPLAKFSFIKDGVKQTFIISVPANHKLRKIDALDFTDFSVRHNHIQSAIEHWFKAQCSLGQCHSFLWENSYKAMLEIGANEQ